MYYNKVNSADLTLSNAGGIVNSTTTSRFPRRLAYVLTVAISVAILLAYIRQEYSVDMEGDVTWLAPKMIYVAFLFYVITTGIYLIYIIKGEILAAVYLLCPLLAVDVISRFLFQPIMPAASFVLIVGAGFFRLFLSQKIKINLPSLLFIILTFTYFLTWPLRGYWKISNADIQYISFTLLLILFSNVFEGVGQVKNFLRTLAYSVAITVIPSLWQFVDELTSGKLLEVRLSMFGQHGFNTTGVNLGLSFLILLLLPTESRGLKKVWEYAWVFLLFLGLVLSGSRWQLFVVLLFGSLALIRENRLFLITIVALIVGIMLFYFVDVYTIQRVLEYDPTFTGRTENWRAAIDMIVKYPLLGIGPLKWMDLNILPVHNPVLALFVYGGVFCGLINIFFLANVWFSGVSLIFNKEMIFRSFGWLAIAAIAIHFSIFYYTYLPFAVIGICLAFLDDKQLDKSACSEPYNTS